MPRRPAALAFTLALACSPDAGDTDTTTGESASTAASASTTDTSTTDTSTTDPSTAADTTTDGPTTSADATTGEPAWCHGWEAGGGAPHLELHSAGVQLVDGGTLALECGAQGLFMFGLYPTFGGFTPAGDTVSFELVVDVPGHNIGPGGHFHSNLDYGYYVGCEAIIGGLFGVVPVFPPDNEDPLTLDGLPASVHVVLRSGADSVTVDLSLTLAVKPDAGFEFCAGG